MILPCEIPQLDIPDVSRNHILQLFLAPVRKIISVQGIYSDSLFGQLALNMCSWPISFQMRTYLAGLGSRSRSELGVFGSLEPELLEKKTKSWSRSLKNQPAPQPCEIGLILFLTSGFAVFICLWLLVQSHSNNQINHILCFLSEQIWVKTCQPSTAFWVKNKPEI